MKSDISTEELLNLRLASQRLSFQKERTPVAMVSHFGAMQAQDALMARWAIGARLPKTSLGGVEKALDEGKILRTHALRPTWHFVPGKDLPWMVRLCAGRVRSSMSARERQLGLTKKIYEKSNQLIPKILEGRALTRDEITAAYRKEKINTGEYRLGHLLMEAELEGIICSGPGKNTYALVRDRIAAQKTLKHDEAVKQLALRYFQSHGPASVTDFTWWSGLSPADARAAVSSLPSKFKTVSCNGNTMHYLSAKIKSDMPAALLLPAYDEYTIAYKDRTAMLDKKHPAKSVSTNGIFYPILVTGGKVNGLWKRTLNGDNLNIAVRLFSKITSGEKEKVRERVRLMSEFYAVKKWQCTFTK